MNHEVRDGSGKVIGYRCAECDHVVQAMWGEICNGCRKKEERHRELIEGLKQLTRIGESLEGRTWSGTISDFELEMKATEQVVRYLNDEEAGSARPLGIPCLFYRQFGQIFRVSIALAGAGAEKIFERLPEDGEPPGEMVPLTQFVVKLGWDLAKGEPIIGDVKIVGPDREEDKANGATDQGIPEANEGNSGR